MSGPVAGYFVERFGSRATAFVASAIGFVGILVASFMTSFGLVVLFMSVLGGEPSFEVAITIIGT